MRGLYVYITKMYEFIYKMKYLDLEMWPELTSYLVGFLEEFVNVKLRPEDKRFPEFKFIYGELYEIYHCRSV